MPDYPVGNDSFLLMVIGFSQMRDLGTTETSEAGLPHVIVNTLLRAIGLPKGNRYMCSIVLNFVNSQKTPSYYDAFLSGY